MFMPKLFLNNISTARTIWIILYIVIYMVYQIVCLSDVNQQNAKIINAYGIRKRSLDINRFMKEREDKSNNGI